MFSVTSELAASLKVQTAPKPTRSEPAQGREQFSDLVDGNLAADNAPATPAPPDQRSAPRHTDGSSPAPDKTSSDKKASDHGAADTEATGTSTPAAGTDSAKAQQPDAKSAASPTVNTDTSASESNEATDSTQRDATPAAEPDSTAAVIAVVIAPPAVVPTDGSQAAANSNAPLAIAAAGLAASASTAAQLTSPTPAKAAADAVAPTNAETAVPAPAVDVTASTKPTSQTNASTIAPAGAKDAAPQAAAVNAEAALTSAANAAPIQPTPVKGAVKTQTRVAPASVASASDASTGKASESATADAGPASAAAAATPNVSPVASGAKAPGDTDLPAAKPQASDGAPSKAPSVALSQDHVTTLATTNSPSDAGIPASSTMQPQISPATTTAAASTSTLGVATPGASAVPLSGLPIEIAASVRSGKTRFDVRLDPADLGRIDVRISVDRNGQIISHLTVERAETLAMLQQDAPQLQRALDDAGLKTGSNGLQFSLRDQSSSGQNKGDDNSGDTRRLIITEDEAVPAAVAGRNYGRMLASSGGIDIRI